MNEITELDLSNVKITLREVDGYVNATELCKAGNREFYTWYRKHKTKAFLKVLSDVPQYCGTELIKVNKGGIPTKQSTWVHPQVAINVAQWISPEFDVKVSRWIYELMLTGKVTLGEEKSYDELEKLREELSHKDRLLTQLNHHFYKIRADYLKLRKNHKELLRHKHVHKLKKGNCFYIISNDKENDERFKVGITNNINIRLKNHKTAIPYLKLDYLIFFNNTKLVEDCMKKRYGDKLDPNNHEFITGTNLEVLKKDVISALDFLKISYTVEDLENLSKYNDTYIEDEQKIDTRKPICIEEKRCPGPLHLVENERLLPVDKFYTNRSTKDGKQLLIFYLEK